MTFGDILDQTFSRLTEFSATAPNLWSRGEVTDNVNEGQIDFIRKTECLWKLYHQIKIVANQTDYALPADCMLLKRVLFDNKTEINPLTWEELDIDDTNWEADSAVDVPDWFYLYDFTTLKLTPKPSTTGTALAIFTDTGKIIQVDVDGVKQTFSSNYGKITGIAESSSGFHYINSDTGKIVQILDGLSNMTIFYIKYPDTLSDDGDIPEIASPWHRALIYYALWMCLKKEGEGQELTRANKYLGRYNYLVNLVKRHQTYRVTRGQYRIRAKRS